MGGDIRYNSCLTNIEIQDSHIKSIEINNNEKIETEVLILAIGHSARDTFRMLNKNKIKILQTTNRAYFPRYRNSSAKRK